MKDKKYLDKINKLQKAWYSNQNYLSRHPELEKFDMPKTFYFRYLPDRQQMHWAIIVPLNNTSHSPATVYFINNGGRVFDKLEFKSIKIARRRLRRNGFDFSTNRYCPFTPPEPIYIRLSEGKKSAPYSKGNLWQSVQRNRKHIRKLEKAYCKQQTHWFDRKRAWYCIKDNKWSNSDDPVNQKMWQFYKWCIATKTYSNNKKKQQSLWKDFYPLFAAIILILLLASALAWFFD